jgi:tetratricopeptide (TPR) repeat protein
VSHVFLSYASADWQLALRVRVDLKRAGLEVWTYQARSEPGVDFREEYLDAVRDARCFCLLDSPQARESGHVRNECRHARECGKSVFVCLATPREAGSHGEWWNEQLPFEDLNFIRAIDLSDLHYDHGVRELCTALGSHYIPDVLFPRASEFRREIYRGGLPFKETDTLVDLWWRFVEFYLEDAHLGEAQLRVLLAHCDRFLSRGAIVPTLSLAVVLSEAARYKEALQYFDRVTVLAPGDPRGWAGKGGSHYYLGAFQDALVAYRTCERVVEAGGQVHCLDLASLHHNIARTLDALGRGSEAMRQLERLPCDGEDLCQVQALRGRLLKADSPERAVWVLERALLRYRNLSLVPELSLVTDLLDCYRLLGWYDREEELLAAVLQQMDGCAEIWKQMADMYFSSDRMHEAMRCLERAAAVSSDTIVYGVELAAMHYRAGDMDEAQRQVVRLLAERFRAPKEAYYLGLALYLAGARELGESVRERARRDALVSTWPTYRLVLQ